MAPKIWDLAPKEMKQITTLNEFKAQNQNLEVRKLSLPTLQNLPSTNRVHYIMIFNMPVVLLRVRGSLSGKVNAAEI